MNRIYCGIVIAICVGSYFFHKPLDVVTAVCLTLSLALLLYFENRPDEKTEVMQLKEKVDAMSEKMATLNNILEMMKVQRR